MGATQSVHAPHTESAALALSSAMVTTDILVSLPYAHTLCATLTPPDESPADTAKRLDRMPKRFLKAIGIAMDSAPGRAGLSSNLRWCAGLSRASWSHKRFWSGLVHVQRGPQKRTHLMYASMLGDDWLVSKLLECDGARGRKRVYSDHVGRREWPHRRRTRAH